MKEYLPEKLKELSNLVSPLYLVGGAVRDFCLGRKPDENTDYDLASPLSEEEILKAAIKAGFCVKAVYRRTGTVKLEADGISYEFTRFRCDRYEKGYHAPKEISFTDDIKTDALRRDFRANAVYYDLKNETFLDPLGGIEDIKKRELKTVAPAEKVFGEDGLRLMRLGRVSAQIGFSPDRECLFGAKANSHLIRDIVPERIFSELTLLLHADGKFGEKDGPYRGLKLLKEIGVLSEILPELTKGEGMKQRPDFHDHDVLEHSLRCVRYSDPSIRFAALLHDVGKPFCMQRDGNYHAHPEEGARLSREILERFKAPKKLVDECEKLVLLHMRDYNLLMKETKLRKELVLDYEILPRLLLLKQADFSACKDDLSLAPCVEKWQNLLKVMKNEGVPFTTKDLKVKGDELKALSIPNFKIKEVLLKLLLFCAEDGRRNEKTILLSRAKALSEGKNL